MREPSGFVSQPEAGLFRTCRTDRFSKPNELAAFGTIALDRRVAVGIAALERMSALYGIWVQGLPDRPGREAIMSQLWEFARRSGSIPTTGEIAQWYPDESNGVTAISARAGHFVEGLQLLSEYARTADLMRLVEIRQAAYDMADDAAGDLLSRYSSPTSALIMTPELDVAQSYHPWVSLELHCQALDLYDAISARNLESLCEALRHRALELPVVSLDRLVEIATPKGVT